MEGERGDREERQRTHRHTVVIALQEALRVALVQRLAIASETNSAIENSSSSFTDRSRAEMQVITAAVRRAATLPQADAFERAVITAKTIQGRKPR